MGEPEEVEAVGPLPARVGVGEVSAEVAQRRRAEEGVDDRVREDIGVGVPVEADVRRDRHAAQDERAPRHEAVDVVAVADAHGGCGLSAPGRGLLSVGSGY